MKNAVVLEMRKVFSIRLSGLQINRADRADSRVDKRGRVIAMYLDDIVLSRRCAQPLPAFSDLIMHPRVVEDAPDEVRVFVLAQTHNSSHQFDSINSGRIER